MFERENPTPDFDKFLAENVESLFAIFDSLQVESNYFSMREALKDQYMLLSFNEPLRKHYVKDKDRLCKIMKTVLNQNKNIQYEAFLHLSLFILMPIESEKIKHVL